MRLLLPVLLVFCLLRPPAVGASADDAWTDRENASRESNQQRIKRGVHWYRYPNKKNDIEQEKFAYQLYRDGRLRKAANAYQALVYAWPDSPKAALAQLALAKTQQKRGRYDEAFNEYQYLIDHYPGQFIYTDVLEFQFQIATYLMHAKTGKFLFFPGFASPERALPMFEKIIRNAPSWDKSPIAQYNIGRIHEMNGNEEEAISAYESLQNRYPSSTWAAQASFREASCLCRLADQRKNDENALNSARAALVDFIRSHPESQDASTARTLLHALNIRRASMAYERARFYDQHTERREAALIAYEDFIKNFPSSDLASAARNRIDQLRKSLP